MYGSGGSRCCLTIVTIAVRLLNCYVSATVAAVVADNFVSFSPVNGTTRATGAEQKAEEEEIRTANIYR